MSTIVYVFMAMGKIQACSRLLHKEVIFTWFSRGKEIAHFPEIQISNRTIVNEVFVGAQRAHEHGNYNNIESWLTSDYAWNTNMKTWVAKGHMHIQHKQREKVYWCKLNGQRTY